MDGASIVEKMAKAPEPKPAARPRLLATCKDSKGKNSG
jgi:hypothetical protein